MRCGPRPDVPEAVPDFVLGNNDRVRAASGATPRLLGTSVHAKTYLRTFPSCHRRAGNQHVCAARHPANVPQLCFPFLRDLRSQKVAFEPHTWLSQRIWRASEGIVVITVYDAD